MQNSLLAFGNLRETQLCRDGTRQRRAACGLQRFGLHARGMRNENTNVLGSRLSIGEKNSARARNNLRRARESSSTAGRSTRRWLCDGRLSQRPRHSVASSRRQRAGAFRFPSPTAPYNAGCSRRKAWSQLKAEAWIWSSMAGLCERRPSLHPSGRLPNARSRVDRSQTATVI